MNRRLTRAARLMSLALGLMLFLSAVGMVQAAKPAPPADLDADVARAWFDLQLTLVQETPGFSPPVASRAFGYSGVALYEAVVNGSPGYQSLAGQLNDLRALPQPDSAEAMHWGVAANSALAAITRELFANASDAGQAEMTMLYARFSREYGQTLDPSVFARSDAYGREVAAAIYAWSTTDGGHQGYTTSFPAGYASPIGVGLWVPTPRTGGDPQPALQPYWGNNRPFVLDSGATCMPSAPPDYSEDAGSDFHAEALEVYDTVRALTPEQEAIALFWADDPGQTATPPGHSISILTQVLRQEDASLALAAEAYARVGIAVADSFIGCWYAKYQYNLLRPVTYIQSLIDAEWMPPVNTPPFPEYTSGHSVQTSATARVLRDLFGENYAFTDHTHDALGLEARRFSSFAEYAEEAAFSRLYGGIHYRAAIEQGMSQGECIGLQVSSLQFRMD